MRYFRVLLYPEEQGLTPPGPPESFGIGKMGETAPKEAVGCILDASHDGKKEILVDTQEQEGELACHSLALRPQLCLDLL
jgi:hypothetical protein